jgi:RNA polymerase sigma-70 factor (ECF subfamily)
MATDIAHLVRDHHAVVYRYAYRLSGSVPDAEDLTQQVFLIAHEKIAQLRSERKVRSWLFAILRNCFRRSRIRRVPMPAGDLQIDLANIPEDTVDDEIDEARLQVAIDGIPAEMRLVLIMFYFETCSYREIAEKLVIPIGTVMSRLSRAKAHLRRQLVPLGVQATDSSPYRDCSRRGLIP